MYEIYINDRPILMTSPEDAEPYRGKPNTLVARYPGRSRFLLNYVDMMEKGHRFDRVVLYSDEVNGLWVDFQSLFQLVEAAGGVVRNPDNELLFIFRRGFWDLPKGKIDPGETPLQAALREVTEETGVAGLAAGKALPDTWHTFRHKGHRILKRTYWFDMAANGEQPLLPQAEEGIEEVAWKSAETFLDSGLRTYANIRRLIEELIGK